MLLGLTGDLPALEEVLGTVERVGSEDLQDRAVAEYCFAAAAQLAGRLDQALRDALAALDLAEGLGLRSDAMVWGWPLAADVAHVLGDTAEVARLLERLDRHRPGRLPRLLRAERLLVRARVQAGEGDLGATAAFDTAVAAVREVGSPYHLAGALLDQAEHQVRVGTPTEAADAAAEAAGIAERLGARPLLARAQRLTQQTSASSADGSVSGPPQDFPREPVTPHGT